jgi:hypothetical protein
VARSYLHLTTHKYKCSKDKSNRLDEIDSVTAYRPWNGEQKQDWSSNATNQPSNQKRPAGDFKLPPVQAHPVDQEPKEEINESREYAISVQYFPGLVLALG